MGALDLVDWPADRTLALSGSAGGLKIPLAFRNSSAQAVHLAEASLAEVFLVGGKTQLRLEPAPIQVSLAGDSVTRTQVRFRLDPSTPPGRYEGQISLAGLARKVAIEVLPQVKLDIRPQPLVIDAAAGREQGLAIAVENRGNVPLTVDLAGAYPLGEEMAIAPQRLGETPQPGNPLATVLDRLAGRTPAPVLTPFGTLALTMPGGAEHLPPGEARAAKVSVKLPENLSPTARYHLFAPLYATDLHIVIVTAAKPPTGRTKGVMA